jgi:hypothetical protein
MRTTIDIDDSVLKKIRAIKTRDGRSLGRLPSDLLAQAQRNNDTLLRMPDARLAALLKENGVTRFHTADCDFRRFEFLKVVDPIG